MIAFDKFNIIYGYLISDFLFIIIYIYIYIYIYLYIEYYKLILNIKQHDRNSGINIKR